MPQDSSEIGTLPRLRHNAPVTHAPTFTIGKLASTGQVGVETIRYYQRRRLLPVPPSTGGGVRRYPAALVDRIHFIKQAQGLGFSLEEIRELLRLESGGSRGAIRRIAGVRLQNMREKMAALARVEEVLAQLLDDCEHTGIAAPCPIIAALSTAHRSTGDA